MTLAKPAEAETVRGVVKGVPALNVREGPGTEHRAVTWVSEGERVDIEEVGDVWARIRTDRGDLGYVHARYLLYPLAVEALGEADGQVADEPLQDPPIPEDVHALRSRNEQLETELDTLRDQVSALQHRSAPPAAPKRDIEDLQTEIRRLVELTEGMRAQLTTHRPGEMNGKTPLYTVDSFPAQPVFSLGFGLAVGILVGSIYGRRKERQRRNRIRL